MNSGLWNTGHLCTIPESSTGWLHLSFFARRGRWIRDLFLTRISQSLTPRWAVFEFWDSTPVGCNSYHLRDIGMLPKARLAPQCWLAYDRILRDEQVVCGMNKRPSLARWNSSLALGHGPNRPTSLAMCQCEERKGPSEPQRGTTDHINTVPLVLFQLLKQLPIFCNRNQYLLLAVPSSYWAYWATKPYHHSDKQPYGMANTKLPFLLALCLLILQVSALVYSGAYQSTRPLSVIYIYPQHRH